MPTEKRQRKKEGQRARRSAELAAARRKQRQRQIILFAIVAALVLGSVFLLSSRGGGKKNVATTASTTTTTAATGGSTTVPTSTPTTPITLPAGKDSISVDRDGKIPTTLGIKDLTEGNGAAAKLGDNITVNYVGVTYVDDKKFDSSFDRGQPVAFDLKEGGLIEGWVKGIPGMKVGGRRQLIIPAAMAYGDNPQGGAPGGALVFVVDLVSIK